MALAHFRPGEAIDLRPLGPQLIETPSRALLRTDRVELMRLVLLAGERIPAHSVDAPATVQPIEGSIRLLLDGQAQPALMPGWLVLIEAGTRYTIEALEDSSLLVTLLLPHQGSASATVPPPVPLAD